MPQCSYSVDTDGLVSIASGTRGKEVSAVRVGSQHYRGRALADSSRKAAVGEALAGHFSKSLDHAHLALRVVEISVSVLENTTLTETLTHFRSHSQKVATLGFEPKL